MKTIVAALAALAVGGGIAYAAIPDAGKVYHACMLRGIGTIRMIDTEKGQRCSSLESEITWNQRGEDGAPGAPGADGVSPTVAQLAAGDANCPAGGAAITDAHGTTAYVCSGQNGSDGQSFSGTFTSPNGQYSLSVGDTGVSITGTGGMHASFTSGGITLQSPDALQLVAGGDAQMSVGSSLDVQTGLNLGLDVGGAASLTTGKQVSISAGKAITVQTAESMLFLPSHDFVVNADRDFTLQGAATGTVSAGGPLNLHGSVINEN